MKFRYTRIKTFVPLFILLITLQVLGSGCFSAPRTNLKVPPPSASFQERVKAYKSFRVKKVRLRFIVYEGQVSSSGGRWIALVLGNGEEVYEPDDLLPAVLPNSRTANAIRNYRKAVRGSSLAWGLGIPLSILVPAALGVGGVAAAGSSGQGTLVLLGTSAALFLGGMISTTVVGFFMMNKAYFNRRRVLFHYDKDLQKRLKIQRSKQRPLKPPPARKAIPISFE